MPTLIDLLKPEDVLCCDKSITCKKQLLEHISNIACREDSEINYVEVLQALIQRERLGSTSVGHGAAIPHARISGLQSPIVCLITLHNAINFDETEPVAVDIIFGILAPKDEDASHVSLLADIANHLKESAYRDKLRNATTSATLYQAALGSVDS